MKKRVKFLLFLLLTAWSFSAEAVYVKKMPVLMIQPNGDTVRFFVTGDEYYHRYHDGQGFTIVTDRDGYWVYAEPAADGGIQPSVHRFGTADPADLGLTPNLKITRRQWQERHKAWEVPEQYRRAETKSGTRNRGDYCNLVIFIRFADDTAYSRTVTSMENMFSDSTTGHSNSVYNYFKHASYNQLHVRTHYAPTPDGDHIRSYQSSHPRCYYMPQSGSNPQGYSGSSQRTQREFDLLQEAVDYVNNNYPVPASVVLDNDGDGTIDNVNFVVKGGPTGWSDLLWPHKWNLYGREVYINGKMVNTFNFALEGGGDYFGTSTFCHEMFHSLGAPDLYHYYEATDITPAGSWDLMHSNGNPPQHMSAYMKYQYGNWIDSIPTIRSAGSYTLYSLGDSSHAADQHYCYKVPSSDPDQFYVLEYRDNSETFETALPSSGLLVWRIDTRFGGNAGYDGEDYLDEVWLFRPGSASNNENGSIGQAAFSQNTNRTEFSPGSNPHPYLSDNSRDLTFAITSIRRNGNTLTFNFTHATAPVDLTHSSVTSVSANLSWLGQGNAYRVAYRRQGSDESFTYRLSRSRSITIAGLEPNTVYEWNVRALYGDNGDGTFADSSVLSATASLHTELCNNSVTVGIGERTDLKVTGMPFVSQNKYNYSQQLFTADELGGAMTISTLSLQYAHTTPLSKDSIKIYLANTEKQNFPHPDSVLPGRFLKLVYTGPFHFTEGWNEVVFDSTFYYNGIDNLVVAIDDNSGTMSRPGERFCCMESANYMSVSFYSNDRNPGPEQDSVVGSKDRSNRRTNIRFVGCPDLQGRIYLCLVSNDEQLGHVQGGGVYDPNDTVTIYAFPHTGSEFERWNDNNTQNPRTVRLMTDTLFIAYFKSLVGIAEATPDRGFVVMTETGRLSVAGAEGQPIEVLDLMGRRIGQTSSQHAERVDFRLPGRGIYLVRVGRDRPAKVFVP